MTVHQPIVTGKGRSALIAEFRALAENDAPPYGTSHHDDPRCQCRRCSYVRRRIILSLYSVGWTVPNIARALKLVHSSVQYHVHPEMRRHKNEYAKSWSLKNRKPKRIAKDVRQGIIAPRREHSRKPDEIHGRIERLVPGPRLELFARQSRPGWTTWGNQATKFDEAAA